MATVTATATITGTTMRVLGITRHRSQCPTYQTTRSSRRKSSRGEPRSACFRASLHEWNSKLSRAHMNRQLPIFQASTYRTRMLHPRPRTRRDPPRRLQAQASKLLTAICLRLLRSTFPSPDLQITYLSRNPRTTSRRCSDGSLKQKRPLRQLMMTIHTRQMHELRPT